MKEGSIILHKLVANHAVLRFRAKNPILVLGAGGMKRAF